MKIVVTGGAGFIGSHLSEAFIGAGHEVAVIDNLSSGRRENLPACAFHELDIRDPRVGQVFADMRPDVLCHHAAQIDVRRSVADPAEDAAVNIIGTLNLLEHCRTHGVRRILFASTGGAIYGEQEVFPASENHPARPRSPYGAAKLAVETYLHYYAVEHGFRPAILRYANVYGPRQDPHGEAGVVAIFCSMLLAGRQPLINGDGEQTRDYVYVGDVVQANCLALRHHLVGAFNVGTGQETTVNQIYQCLCAAVGREPAPQHGPAKPGEQRRSSISAQTLTQATGFAPATPLDHGLRETLRYFEQRQHAA